MKIPRDLVIFEHGWQEAGVTIMVAMGWKEEKFRFCQSKSESDSEPRSEARVSNDGSKILKHSHQQTCCGPLVTSPE